MMKISIKREQSQAGLSFAEREKFRPQVKNKLLLLLALLLTAATGAWAQTETLLKTITNTGENASFKSGSKTFDDIATVTFSNGVYNDGDEWGWYAAAGESSLLTVAGADGYTITRVKFYSEKGSAFDEEAPFEATVASTHAYVNGTDIGQYGVNKIEVYGYEGTAEPAAAGYTVSMKDGVKDADKWTVKVGEGQAQALPIGGLTGDGSETVTLKYNGRLKVKSVKATSDAPAAKPAATVTTAPTGAAVVGVGKTTALVSGGVADGGTLWYAVTTTNTKPTSTDGFSADVPTAESITASGKVYVWYYVKGDDTHSDSEIAATAIEVPVADVVWDATNLSDLYVSGTYASSTIEGITLSGNADQMSAMWNGYGDPTHDGIAFNMNESGGYTFTAPNGKAFTKIVMKPQGQGGWDMANLGTGWTFNADYNEDIEEYIFTVTWKGNAAASTVVLLKDADMFAGETISYIVFYLSDAE